MLGIAGLSLGGGAFLTVQAVAADQQPNPPAGLSPEKLELLEHDRAFDKENESIASDSQKLNSVADAKAADHAAHLKELAALPAAPVVWPTGIFEDNEAPASGTVFLGTNRWVGRFGDDYVAVYAGRAGDDPSVGTLIVAWSDPNRPGKTVTVPGVGSLGVASVLGSVVTLRDSSGGVHFFDALLAKWVG